MGEAERREISGSERKTEGGRGATRVKGDCCSIVLDAVERREGSEVKGGEQRVREAL